MSATLVKIENKRYRIIPEEDYIALINDIKDLKKVLKRKDENGIDAISFFKAADKKMHK